MKLTLHHQDHQFHVDTREARSLAITLDFEGPQPNHFGTARAARETLKLGEFTGDTEAGGSCNVDTLSMIPHCNGTHTETISHIVNEDIWIGHAAMDAMMVAGLVTVRPVKVGDTKTSDSYRPPLEAEDWIITEDALTAALKTIKRWEQFRPQALILRTLPNPVDKRARAYAEGTPPPFLTIEAMRLIDRLEIHHLLVDFPSVDRMYDDGKLTNHHLFWHVPEGGHTMNEQSRQNRTITEMVFVEDEIRDGVHALNLQIPALGVDAAPSRPILFPTRVTETRS